MSSKYPLVGYFCFMFEIFRRKSQIELHLEEYLSWKTRYSPYIAEKHAEILRCFVKHFKYKNLKEFSLQDFKNYYEHCRNISNGTEYNSICIMEAIRGLLSYYKRSHNINPRTVTNRGVVELQYVEDNAIVPVMKQIKRGRPLKVALIEQVKRLRDNENLSFRAIAKAMNKDVSQVYVWYKFDLQKKLLTNA